MGSFKRDREKSITKNRYKLRSLFMKVWQVDTQKLIDEVIDDEFKLHLLRIYTPDYFQNFGEKELCLDDHEEVTKYFFNKDCFYGTDVHNKKVENLRKKIKRLASYCDGASTVDGQGFSRFDAPIGHKLANQTRYTEEDINKMEYLVKKYRKQLGE
jgi:hypothetical protein